MSKVRGLKCKDLAKLAADRFGWKLRRLTKEEISQDQILFINLFETTTVKFELTDELLSFLQKHGYTWSKPSATDPRFCLVDKTTYDERTEKENKFARIFPDLELWFWKKNRVIEFGVMIGVDLCNYRFVFGPSFRTNNRGCRPSDDKFHDRLFKLLTHRGAPPEISRIVGRVLRPRKVTADFSEFEVLEGAKLVSYLFDEHFPGLNELTYKGMIPFSPNPREFNLLIQTEDHDSVLKDWRKQFTTWAKPYLNKL